MAKRDDDWVMSDLAKWPEAEPPPLARGPRVEDAARLNDTGPHYGPEIPPAPTGRMLPAPDIPTKVNPEVSKAVAEAFIPQEPWEWGALLASRGASRLPAVARLGGMAGSALLQMMNESEAAPIKAGKKALEVVKGFAPGAAFEGAAPAIKKGTEAADAPVLQSAAYINNPVRVANPGVYKRPDVIAAEAAARVEPEHPALKQLFGVTRQDLYDISQQGRRQGNVEPKLWTPDKPGKPNEAAVAVMTPANEQRIIDTLTEARKHEGLEKGMVPWYVMDPLYQHMVKLVGPERARKEYMDFNMSMTPFSAGSSVIAEINRGTAANMYRQRGDYETFLKYGGLKATGRDVPGYPEDLRDVKGMMGHRNQANPVQRYMDTGSHGYGDANVKIDLYSGASGVPQTGFQTTGAVPDAHFTRAIGVPDARKNPNDFNEYMIGTEYRQIGPWYRQKIADPLGIEAVPAQALMWGTYGPQTGVKTKIGAGKLELLSKQMWERAQKLGIDPYDFRDQVLRGEQHSELEPRDQMGGLAAQNRYTA